MASSLIFSLILSRRRRSTALWLSRRRRRFSFAMIALDMPQIRLTLRERKRSMGYDSLFSGCILSRVCSNVFRANPACTRSAETAKGARAAQAVRGRERELLVPCTSRVYREWGDGEGRGGLAVGGDEDRMWMRAMSRRGGGTNAAAFLTGGACGTTVGRWWLGSSRWARA